ncbi:deoxyribodipyrimidine photo-lyase [Seonamhaeicola sp. ML3]|uniref:cryptochrome/photolyase family protein n=1 Tax=Seonamhaeicola sp. ML3 TaxID=2937786 RepID=UPI00200CE669|nr:deoxyribodipyrimidine photo-lyase [Seonamhaeicola sp. ML3]
MPAEKISIFWFRRDLRLEDNTALTHALNSEYPVLPIFIFDDGILNELDKDDARVNFIHSTLSSISSKINKEFGGSLYVLKGTPLEQWQFLLENYDIQGVYANEDYEPYAIKRDSEIKKLLSTKAIQLNLYKDQVIFAKNDVLKKDNTPYTVFTPFKNQWLKKFDDSLTSEQKSKNISNFYKTGFPFPSLTDIGFTSSAIEVKDYRINDLENYEAERNFPALDKTSYLSPHLRFGTVSVRKLVKHFKQNATFLSELIWREFFMQILFHFPDVVQHNFKRKYDHIPWRNNEEEFEQWKQGKTGYPMVDAGMRELNATGYMHNRVRMVVASFLCKHLLIDWRWGEAYFAKKLLDFELSSNNGNWQWAAGTGCDAAPYFRVFNPSEQVKKFDKNLSYINKWVPELNSLEYPAPMVDHKEARERAISTYKNALS